MYLLLSNIKSSIIINLFKIGFDKSIGTNLNGGVVNEDNNAIYSVIFL